MACVKAVLASGGWRTTAASRGQRLEVHEMSALEQEGGMTPAQHCNNIRLNGADPNGVTQPQPP